MIIVRLTGRLGNQMFQYALARSLQSHGKEVYLDSSMLKYDGNHYELGIYPGGSEISETTTKDKNRLGDCKKEYIFKMLQQKLKWKKQGEYVQHKENM